MPTANSIDMVSRGGMTTPNTMIATPTAMTVTVCPTPQAAPINAEPATLRWRLTIVAMATTWSASVACRIPRKKPRNRKDTTSRAAPVIAKVSRWLAPYYAAFRPTPIPTLLRQLALTTGRMRKRSGQSENESGSERRRNLRVGWPYPASSRKRNHITSSLAEGGLRHIKTSPTISVVGIGEGTFAQTTEDDRSARDSQSIRAIPIEDRGKTRLTLSVVVCLVLGGSAG